MTLTHGRFISYEYDRMVVLFSMLDGDKEIPCAVSTSAMDELDGVVRARAGQREAQFMRLRAHRSARRRQISGDRVRGHAARNCPAQH